MMTLEVDGKVQTFPLIKAAKGSAQARAKLKNLYPI
jgi:large subunit ribosomal protein L28